MKLSFKTTTHIAAIGITLYAIHVVLRLRDPIHDAFNTAFGAYSISRELYFVTWYAFLIVCMLSIIVAALKTNTNLDAPQKSYRVVTYILAGSLLIASAEAMVLPVRITGVYYLVLSEFWRVVLPILSSVWAWMLYRENSAGTISKSLRIAMIIGACALCIPILLQLISGISYLCTDHILFLRSWAIYSFVKVLVPTILLCWYSIDCHRTKN